jgi:hypothetical protein
MNIFVVTYFANDDDDFASVSGGMQGAWKTLEDATAAAIRVLGVACKTSKEGSVWQVEQANNEEEEDVGKCLIEQTTMFS